MNNKHLFWFDMESTGLLPQSDIVLEVGLIITDFNLEPKASYQSFVRNSTQELKAALAASPWGKIQPASYFEVFLRECPQAPTLFEVQKNILKILDQYFSEDEKIILAGNTIGTDRRFIEKYFQKIESRLHYRMLDVSAWKVFFVNKYGLQYPKKNKHQALEDIKESISELAYYLKWFNEPTSR